MKRKNLLITLLSLALGVFVFVSCKDRKEEDVVVDPPVVCSLPNGTIKWKDNGVEYCANGVILADQGIILTVYGLSGLGQSMTLEMDSVSVGTHALTADYNYLLYTDALAIAYEATNEQPGTMTITGHNETTNRIEGTFQINAVNPLNGVSKQITDGQFSVTYTE